MEAAGRSDYSTLRRMRDSSLSLFVLEMLSIKSRSNPGRNESRRGLNSLEPISLSGQSCKVNTTCIPVFAPGVTVNCGASIEPGSRSRGRSRVFDKELFGSQPIGGSTSSGLVLLQACLLQVERNEPRWNSDCAQYVWIFQRFVLELPVLLDIGTVTPQGFKFWGC